MKNILMSHMFKMNNSTTQHSLNIWTRPAAAIQTWACRSHTADYLTKTCSIMQFPLMSCKEEATAAFKDSCATLPSQTTHIRTYFSVGFSVQILILHNQSINVPRGEMITFTGYLQVTQVCYTAHC